MYIIEDEYGIHHGPRIRCDINLSVGLIENNAAVKWNDKLSSFLSHLISESHGILSLSDETSIDENGCESSCVDKYESLIIIIIIRWRLIEHLKKSNIFHCLVIHFR